MAFDKIKSLLLYMALACIIISAGCNSESNLDKNCTDVCHGNELWGQIHDNGKCIDYIKKDNCSVTCGCTPKELTFTENESQKDDPCAMTICDTICDEGTLWSTKCINGNCVKNRILQECSSKCDCDPYIFSEISTPKKSYFLSTTYANVYSFNEGDVLRVTLTCRNSSCLAKPLVYYVYLGNKDLPEIEKERLQVVTNTKEWRIPTNGNYAIIFSKEYYLKIGYLYEK